MDINADIFVAVKWFDVQELMDKKGFTDNATLITDGPLCDEYGYSAYMVRITWLLNNNIYRIENN